MKRFLAIITALVFITSVVPLGVAAEDTATEIVNMDFNHPVKGQIAAATFSAYDSEVPATSITVENSALKVEMESDWNNNNGVKTEITDVVKNNANSGDTFTLSYTAQTWAWQGDSVVNKATGFILAGDTITQLVSGPDDAADGDACQLTGSAPVEFGAEDKIYLCFTHGASVQVYDDIILTVTPKSSSGDDEGGDGDGDGGDESGEWSEIYSETFVSEGTREDTDWVAMTDKTTVVQKEWGVLVGNDDGASYDITDLVSGGMQLKVETAFGVNTDDQKINANISVIKGSEETVCNDAESSFAIDPELVNDSWGGSTLYNPVEFTATLPARISASAKVYLNLSFASGYYKIDYVNIYVNPDSVGGAGEENFSSLTSYQEATGSFFPASAQSVMLHDFGSADGAEQLALYSAYKTPFSKDPVLSSGAAQFSFDSDWSADNGVIIDLTELFSSSVPENTPVRVSFSIKANYWGSNPGDATVDANLNISGTNNKVISYAPAETTTSVTHSVSGIFNQGITSGDTVKLSITQKSGGFVLDNIKIEIPYSTAHIYDVAVSDENDLPSYVYASYGSDEEKYEVDVKWEDYDGAPVIYGVLAGINTAKAKAVITDTAYQVTQQSGSVSSYSVSVGTDASLAAEKAVVVDSLTNWNQLSKFRGETITAQSSSASVPVKISDNNDGTVCIEGNLGTENASALVMAAICEGESVVWFNQVKLTADGSYKIAVPISETGNLTVYMGNLYSGVAQKADFAYASTTDFNLLKEKIAQADDLATVFEQGEDFLKNRDTLGTQLFEQFLTLDAPDKTNIYTMLKTNIPTMTRAQAAAFFDGNTAIAKTNKDADGVLFLNMLNATEEYFEVQDTDIYKKLKNSFAPEQVTDVVTRVRMNKATELKAFKEAVLGSALSVGINNAQHYTEAASLVQNNKSLFTAYNLDVSSLSMTASGYIMNYGGNSNNLSALASVVKTALEQDNAQGGGITGGGGGGGGGGTPPKKDTASTESIFVSSEPLNQVEPIPDPPVDDGRNFSDLTEEVVWAIDSINNLAEAGVLSGFEDGSFRPTALVTREEFVCMLAKALNAGGVYESNFWDVPKDRWSYSAVSFAYSTGIVKGQSDNYFGAAQAITRQDLAVMSYMALWQSGKIPKRGELTFSDKWMISDYAKEAVAALHTSGIVSGVGDNLYSPGEYTTRAEAAVILERIINYK